MKRGRKVGNYGPRTKAVLAWLDEHPAARLVDCSRALGIPDVAVRSVSSRYRKPGQQAKARSEEKMRVAKLWLWMNPTRVRKWNALRAAESQPPATRDQMAECLAELDLETLAAIKERLK